LLPRIATLRKLHISPPSYRAFTIHRLPKFLPLVSGFSQLEALSIVRWRLQVEQYHNLRHLLKLRNLRVRSCAAAAIPLPVFLFSDAEEGRG
jgi:hypothetical protein